MYIHTSLPAIFNTERLNLQIADEIFRKTMYRKKPKDTLIHPLPGVYNLGICKHRCCCSDHLSLSTQHPHHRSLGLQKACCITRESIWRRKFDYLDLDCMIFYCIYNCKTDLTSLPAAVLFHCLCYVRVFYLII